MINQNTLQSYLSNDDIPVPTKEEGGEEIVHPIEENEDNQERDVVADITINIDDFYQEDVIEKEIDEDISAMRKYSDQLNRNLDDIDTYIRNVNCNRISLESIGVISGTFAGVANIFGHMINLFATSIFHGFKDFKRSELTAYVDSNFATAKLIYGTKTTEVHSLMLDIPQGMKGSYPEALGALSHYLKALKMGECTKRMLAMVEAIEKDLRKSVPNFSSHVQTAYRELKPESIDKLFANTAKYLTPETKLVSSTFSHAYGDMATFKTTVENTIKLDSELREVASVHSRLLLISKTVNKIIEHENKLDQNQLTDISKMIRLFGNVFEQYGHVINDVNRLNHNITLNFRSIRNHLEQ